MPFDIEKIRRVLPNVRPIAQFIHRPLFPHLLERDITAALDELSFHYGVDVLGPMSQYQRLYAEGAIAVDLLEDVVRHQRLSAEDVALLFREDRTIRSEERCRRPLHQQLNQSLGFSLADVVDPQLARLFALYFSEELQVYSEEGAWQFFLKLEESALTGWPAGTRELLRRYRERSALDACAGLLGELVPKVRFWQSFATEAALSLRGWAGFFSTLEQEPQLLERHCHVTLADFLAIRLFSELCWARALAPEGLERFRRADLHAHQSYGREDTDLSLKLVWQEAWELTQARAALEALTTAPVVAPQIEQLAVFCIDDRECHLRAALERQSPSVSTASSPGFFAMDVEFALGPLAKFYKHCPLPVTPSARYIARQAHELPLAKPRGFFAGLKDLLQLGGGISAAPEPELVSVADPMLFTVRTLGEGLDLAAAAQRVASVLKTLSTAELQARDVWLIGHHSRMVNNAFVVAYGCGACSGRSGALNAQLFCQLANQLEVRRELALRHGIFLAPHTRFLAGVHDTGAERFTAFLAAEDAQRPEVQSFLAAMGRALTEAARARARDFDLTADDEELTALLAERTQAPHEPRPELGHSGHALCIVGPRTPLHARPLAQRTFLQSYTPEADTSGELLRELLRAIVPVCAGINLDYTFSRWLNPAWSAGSKVTQNLTGLVGLSHGSEDDLLIGLPLQMIDRHTPVRLTLVIEQSPAVLDNVLADCAELRGWFANRWVLLLARAPGEAHYLQYRQGQWAPLVPGAAA